ncbi:hypothetical protein ONZ51_g4618 [Trametes cubensis]|uniref:Uncharacterized protein n=1 Tax=Trametes cubensis TaxID=1111947 RepID=A0AAD7TXZ2_9APHY|nr:hypothetical protein ONZ51_g4618 [Trametes cubensis]
MTSNDRSTFIDYATTPASEQSVYFDAPIAVWSNKSSDGTPRLLPDAADDHATTLPGAFEPDHSESDNATKRLSVGTPRDPAVREHPLEAEEDKALSRFTEDIEGATKSPDSKSAHRRATSATDSGYGSASGMEPIPVVWTESPSQEAHHRGQVLQRSLDDEDEDGDYRSARRDSPFKRASSLRSFRSMGHRASIGGTDTDDRGSVKTSPSLIRRRRISLTGGSFASGAGTVGPASSAMLDESFDERSRTAEMSMSEKQKMKLTKTQLKEGKKVVKIIKAEGKAEKKALDEAVKELADIQKLQKTAVKEEAKSYSTYAKALREFHKAELEFFAARAKYERAQADLKALEDVREASKQHAQETTEMLQEKNREVEWLRAQKATDDDFPSVPWESMQQLEARVLQDAMFAELHSPHVAAARATRPAQRSAVNVPARALREAVTATLYEGNRTAL